MLGKNEVNEALALKELARCRHKKMIDKERLVRLSKYHPNRCNVDTEYLDMQCEERRQKNANDQATGKMEMEQTAERERELANNDADMNMFNAERQTEIMGNWEDSLAAKKQREADEQAVKDFDYEVAGPSSMLFFEGESQMYHKDEREKKMLQRSYVHEQLAEQANEKAIQGDEDKQFADMMKIVDQMRQDAENEEKEIKQYVTNNIKDHNLSLAAGVKEKKMRDIAESKGKGGIIIKSLLDEDKQSAMNSNGRVYRRDMFKGFTVDQRRKIFDGNQAVVEAKFNSDTMRSNNDYEYSLTQELQLKAMEATEYDERATKEEMNREYGRQLLQQAEDKRKTAKDFKNSQFGGSSNLLDQMGKSAR